MATAHKQQQQLLSRLQQQQALTKQQQQQLEFTPHHPMQSTPSAVQSVAYVAGMRRAGSAAGLRLIALLGMAWWLAASLGTAARQLAAPAAVSGSAAAGLCAKARHVCAQSARCLAAASRVTTCASTGMSSTVRRTMQQPHRPRFDRVPTAVAATTSVLK